MSFLIPADFPEWVFCLRVFVLVVDDVESVVELKGCILFFSYLSLSSLFPSLLGSPLLFFHKQCFFKAMISVSTHFQVIFL